MNLRIFPFALFLILLIQTGIYAKTEKIKLAIGYIPHIQFAPLYAGIEKGFYSRNNIELSIEYGFGIDIFSLLENEKIDIGLSDSDQLIIAGSKKIKIGAIYQYYQKYPVSIISLNDGRIKSPSDLKSKTIGTPEIHGTSYIGLKEFLGKFNLGNKVRIEKIGYTQIQSLISGKVDAVVCFSNNEPVQLKIAGKDIIQWNVSGFSELPGASFITGYKIVKSKSESLKKFIKATGEAMDWVVNNQEEAFEVSKKYLQGYNESQYKFDIECLKETSKLFINKKGYGYIDPEKYKKSLDTLYDLKLIDKKFDVNEIIYAM